MDIPSSSPPPSVPVGTNVQNTPASSPPLAAPPKSSPRMPQYLVWIISVFVLSIAITTLYFMFSRDKEFLETERFVQSILHADSVAVGRYILGSPFVVKHVTLSKPGFMVVLSESALKERRHIVLGRSSWLPEGRAQNVVMLSTELATEVVGVGDAVFVTLYYDDGDRELNIDKDVMALGWDGKPIGVIAQVY